MSSTHGITALVVRPMVRAVVTALVTVGAGQAAMAQPDPLAAADLPHGEQLIADKACTACHQRKLGGDGLQLYKPGKRVNSKSELIAMVERCNTELNLGMFPDEVVSVAAVLNRDHYRLGGAAPKR